MKDAEITTKLALPRIEGRTFVVGDVHGHFSNFMAELSKQGFNEKKDRVICVGDLIDRGPQNLLMIRLLDEPWFHSVLGNHEVFVLASCNGDRNSFSNLRCWLENGGKWAIDELRKKQELPGDDLALLDMLAEYVKPVAEKIKEKCL